MIPNVTAPGGGARALIFVTVRSFVNGVKRALTSPKRLIGLLFFGLYYWNFLIRPFSGAGRSSGRMGRMFDFPTPSVASLEAIAFGLFAAMSAMLMLSLFSYRGTFRQADVDVLFATPVSPRLVLGFRVLRDHLLTLVLPLIFGILAFPASQAGVKALNRSLPDQGFLLFRTGTIAWLLLSFAWVCVGYCASLFVNRTSVDSDKIRVRLGWVLFVIIAGTLAYGGWVFRNAPSFETALGLAHSPLFRTVFPLAGAAAALTVAPISGQPALAVIGFVALVGVSALGLWRAMAQAGWLYDDAAMRTDELAGTARARRSGDAYAILNDQAQKGKLKVGRFSRWISRKAVRGPMALLWKEMILQYRTSLFGPLLVVLAIGGMMAWLLFLLRDSTRRPVDALILGLEGMLTFFLSMASMTGYLELLRRGDVMKPLPFPARITVFWEVAGKAAGVLLIIVPMTLVAVVLAPNALPAAITGMVVMPTLSLALVATVLVVTLLAPDFDDPTQRGYRQLLMLLGLALAALPCIGILGGTYALKLNPLVAILPSALVNGAICFVACLIAGELYANYNPSE